MRNFSLINVVVFILLLGFWPAISSSASQESLDDTAVASYRKAIAVDPQDVIAHFNLGLALYKSERYEDARKVLEKCLKLNSRDSEALKQVAGPANQILGIIYYTHLRDDRRAIKALERSLKLLPHDPDTYYAIGLARIRLKDMNAAIRDFEQAVQYGDARQADVFFQLGRAQLSVGQNQAAIASYQKALEIEPEFKVVLENLALLYHNQKDDKNTITVLNRLVKLEPMNFNANYLLGLHYYRKKDYSQMVKAFNRAVAVKPDQADAHYNLGMAYYYQTRYDMAVKALKKAVALNSQDSEAYNLLGQAQTEAVETHIHQGSTYLAQEKYTEAVTEFKTVLAMDPNNQRAGNLLKDTERRVQLELAECLRLADKYYKKNRLAEAYSEYAQALKLDPDSQPANEGLKKAQGQIGKVLAIRIKKARVSEKMSDFKEARRQYESALEINPDYAPAKKALNALKNNLTKKMKKLFSQAVRQADQDNLASAAKHYQRVLKLARVFDAAVWQEKTLARLSRINARIAELVKHNLAEGKTAFKSGKSSEAKVIFSRVLKLDPKNKTANKYILKLTGAASPVKVTAELIKTTYYRGVDYYVRGQIEEAIQEWEKVVALDPEHQDAQINIERARAKLVAIKKLTQGR